MLIIAVGHGSFGPEGSDPFTCSVQTRADYNLPEPVDAHDAKACRDFICQKQNLNPDMIDEILVVFLPDYDGDPEVTSHSKF